MSDTDLKNELVPTHCQTQQHSASGDSWYLGDVINIKLDVKSELNVSLR